MRCQPKDIFKPTALVKTLAKRNGDTDDIIHVIMSMDGQSDAYINKRAAECLRGRDNYETLDNVWAFIKANVRYKADAPGKEIIKSPAALFKMGYGDCKSFTIAAIALMRALGIKNLYFRFAAYPDSKGRMKTDITHVYARIGRSGREVILDAVHTRFDEEVEYAWKRDIQAHVSGIRQAKTTQNRPILKLFAFGLLAWALTQ